MGPGQRPAAQLAVRPHARRAPWSRCRARPSSPAAGGRRSRGSRRPARPRSAASRGRCRWRPASAAGPRPPAGPGWRTRWRPTNRLSTDGSRLLDLEEQRVGGRHGRATGRSSTACRRCRRRRPCGPCRTNSILLQQVPAVGFQRAPVLRRCRLVSCASKAVRSALVGQQLGDRDEQRRVGDDPRLAVDDAGQLGHACMLSLVRALAMPSSSLLRWRAVSWESSVGPQLVHVGAGVPDVQVGHGREAAHREPVAGDRRGDDLTALP